MGLGFRDSEVGFRDARRIIHLRFEVWAPILGP